MNFETISDIFSQEISDINIEAVLFTTYNLEVSFFETEVIPLLFSDVGVFSNDIRIKELQVREKLESTKIALDLFYDERMFEQERQSSSKSTPSMEYGFFGITHGNEAFHAKVTLVLGTNRAEEKELILFAGSNNLTKAGWWDNVETVNSIRLSNKRLPSQEILDSLHSLIEYLVESNALVEQSNALREISVFLNQLSASNKYYADTQFYFSYERNFPTFLEESLGKNYKALEIVSPYFPDDEKSKLHEVLHVKGKIYLPVEQKDEIKIAQCSESFYAHIKENGLQWAQFQKDINNELSIGKRMVHAKLYLLVNETGNWVFSGSVNFTYKALYDNIEAGFLFKVDSETTLLEKLRSEPLDFLPENITEENTNKRENTEEEFFTGQILFDWTVNQKRLMLFGEMPLGDECYLKSHNEEVLLSIEKDVKSYVIEENSLLTKHLEKNGYIVLACSDCTKDVYVQQINWVYKPLDYPELSLEEIISIYSAMNPEKRDRYIVNALIRKFVQAGEETEYTRSIDQQSQVKSFFSEYAELFYAFRRVHDVCQKEPERLKYYLFAERPDSISTLLTQLDKDEKSDHVMKYLILLSAKELYKEYGYPFKKYGPLLTRVKKTFEDKKFLKWFEKEFFKNYTQKAVNE